MSTKEAVTPQDKFTVEVEKIRIRVNNLRKTKPGPKVDDINERLIKTGRKKVKNNASLKDALAELSLLEKELAQIEK